MNKYDVCIIGGAGHVGLPLAICLASKQKKVIVYDIDEKKIELINNGEMPFKEDGAEIVLEEVLNKTLFLSSNIDSIKKSEIIIIVVGTPVDEHLNPTFNIFNNLLSEIKPMLDATKTIILRSTVFPGTTERLNYNLQLEFPGIEVCFCPERIAEGKAMIELFSLPQIISGFSDNGLKKARELFGVLTSEMITLEPLEAELAKLFTNSWRYIQFAIANQFYMISNEYNVDFYKIFTAMKYNYPRASSFPSPGFAAGPCLFKDTMQISAATNNNFFLGHSAMLVNEGLPNFIIKQLKMKYDLKEMRLGILGMAFKAESDDIRESLSYKIKKLGLVEFKEVRCYDPYVKMVELNDLNDVLDNSDILIIGAPHNEFKKLNLRQHIVFDVWDIINNTN